ncbi:condensation domain-containing protein, partial [Streptomyces formicae]
MHVKFGSEGRRLPLTASQHGMWLYQQLDPTSPTGCAAEFVEITGPLDEELLEEALRRAVQDTEALRVRFEEGDRGQVRQILTDDPPSPIERHDLRDAPSPAQAARAWMRSRLFRPIDLRHGVALSVALLRTEDERRLLYIGVHHIALDGYGFSLFIQRLAEIYTALEQGRSVAPAPWPTLAELIADEDAYRHSPRWQEDLSYWSEQVRTRDPVPGTAARLKPLTNLPHRETGHIAPAAAEALRGLARQARTSLPAVAMAALALYVHRLTGRAQVSLDLTVTSRTGKVCRAVPSMLANVLPLAVRCRGELTVRELMRETARQARDLLRHQRFPAGHLVRDLGAPKPGGFLGDWGINIMGYDEPLAFGRCPATLHNLSNGPCDGLAVNVYERSADGTLRIDFNAGADTYPPAEVRAHHERFLALLETLAAADPELPVGSLDVLTHADRGRLSAVHGPTPEVPARLLPELVQERARRTPEARAVVDRVTSLTYRELNSRANRLARLLVAHGAGPERHVALALSRTAAYPLAVLAVLKAGAACVPLDPGHPAERLRHVLAETRPVCVVTDTAALDGLVDCPSVRIGADGAAEPGRPGAEGCGDHDLTDGDRVSPLLPRHPAYVSYTSGSSGRPKGVVVEHRSLTHLYFDHERELIAPAARAAGRPQRAPETPPKT